MIKSQWDQTIEVLEEASCRSPSGTMQVRSPSDQASWKPSWDQAMQVQAGQELSTRQVRNLGRIKSKQVKNHDKLGQIEYHVSFVG